MSIVLQRLNAAFHNLAIDPYKVQRIYDHISKTEQQYRAADDDNDEGEENELDGIQTSESDDEDWFCDNEIDQDNQNDEMNSESEAEATA